MINKRQILFLNLILLQVFLSCYLAISYLNHSMAHIFEIPAIIVVIIVVLVGLLCLLTVKELLRLAKKEKDAEIALARLEENRILIDALKAKQHDFANHLQVLYGLFYSGEKSALKSYMKDISKDLNTLDKVASLKSVEVAALICKKMALTENVVIEPVIKTDLGNLSVPPDKMISILGNLMDNAIYEAKKQKDENKVRIEISENDGYYVFEIWNHGHIPPELFDKVFEPGFTTKGKDGSGMGLNIVKNIVKQYGGRLEFVSGEDTGTTFRVYLPQKEEMLSKTN